MGDVWTDMCQPLGTSLPASSTSGGGKGSPCTYRATGDCHVKWLRTSSTCYNIPWACLQLVKEKFIRTLVPKPRPLRTVSVFPFPSWEGWVQTSKYQRTVDHSSPEWGPGGTRPTPVTQTAGAEPGNMHFQKEEACAHH